MYILKYKLYDDSVQLSYFKNTTSSSVSKSKSFSVSDSVSDSEKSKLSRSCSRLKDIILCNNFDFFVTLTNKDCLFDNTFTSIEKFNSFIARYKKLAYYYNKDLKFEYVYVFEKTKKDGVHLHGFFKGFFDLYENQYGHLSSLYFDKLGFQCFENAKEVNPYYLIKYITKDPCYIKQVYHCSRGLKRPKVEYYHDHYKKFFDLPFTFNNGYCKMITFTR